MKRIAEKTSILRIESPLQDPGFDSLDTITMLFELHNQFQISVSEDPVRSIRNVGDLVEGIASLVANASLDSATPEGKQ